jgi:hypothetical protein
MAIADYSELVLAVGEHINRADIVDAMPRFVRMAELKLNRELRLRDQEAVVTLTPDINGEAALPTDFLEARSVTTQALPPVILPSLTEDNAARKYASGTASGFIINGDTIRIRPAGTASITLRYFTAIPSLEAAANQQNWLLTKYPDVYLYSVIFEACVYTGDEARAQAANQLARAAIASTQRYNAMSKHSMARVRVSGMTP